jgi:putative hydrolase of HD superfamily
MKTSKKFRDLIDFIQFTHEFREVIRVARAPYADRYENDAEHSYQLAMVAWYLIETDGLNLNRELCFMYALAHDLVEVYAGDTYTFDTNQNNHLNKKDREKKALLKIKKRFPKFKLMVRIIEKYESKKDKESKFIYALDKLIPPIQIFLEKGKLWNERKISLEKIIDNKSKKISISKTIDVYWQELLRELIKDNKKLFL